jgi:membrane-associated protease RseP (regulator of RpoE activity)
LTGGISYGIAVVSILLAHEMGHYLMSRRYGVPATLPYFIPFPFLNPFGTLGAVIRMKGTIPSRKALFDIGSAGPFAGLIITFPVLVLGVALSSPVPVTSQAAEGLVLGESLLFKFLITILHGPIPDSMDLMLHPVAYAGWVGLLVTALNLLPIGQLDGGHVLYSVFGPRSQKVVYIFLGFLGVLSLIYPGWILLFMLLLLLGRNHPAPFDDMTPLDRRRKLLALLLLLIFATSFMPTPFKL